eukprot:13035116-Alexandrium_andersonii.AAC.1
MYAGGLVCIWACVCLCFGVRFHVDGPGELPGSWDELDRAWSSWKEPGETLSSWNRVAESFLRS